MSEVNTNLRQHMFLHIFWNGSSYSGQNYRLKFQNIDFCVKISLTKVWGALESRLSKQRNLCAHGIRKPCRSNHVLLMSYEKSTAISRSDSKSWSYSQNAHSLLWRLPKHSSTDIRDTGLPQNISISSLISFLMELPYRNSFKGFTNIEKI